MASHRIQIEEAFETLHTDLNALADENYCAANLNGNHVAISLLYQLAEEVEKLQRSFHEIRENAKENGYIDGILSVSA
jgi:hypothetical protein